MAANYSFQLGCNAKMLTAIKGVIALPTGSGKSRIEFNHVLDRVHANDNHKVFVITMPRIVLGQQLIQEFCDHLLAVDASALEQMIFVSSGEFPEIKSSTGKVLDLEEQALQDTNKRDIVKRLKMARDAGQNVYMFSTYKSFNTCMKSVAEYQKDSESEIHLVADEAHYFTRAHDAADDIEINERLGKVSKAPAPYKVLTKHIDLFTSRFFFTATPKVKPLVKGSGLNNEEVYGPLDFFAMKPVELIPQNIICTPSLLKAELPDAAQADNMNRWVGDFILSTYNKHEELIRAQCGDQDVAKTLGAKLLVAITGSKQLITLLYATNKSTGKTFLDEAREQGITVAWTMSRKKGMYVEDGEELNYEIIPSVDGMPYRKQSKFLGAMRNTCQDITYDPTKQVATIDKRRLIVLHYDQLTEGIDIPSMTGLLILRNMELDKSLQSIGRVLRMHPADRSKDYADRDATWIKPYAQIIVPNLKDLDKTLDGILKMFIEDYDPDQIIDDLNEEADGTGSTKKDKTELTLDRPVALHDDVRFQITELAKWAAMIDDQVASGTINNISVK